MYDILTNWARAWVNSWDLGDGCDSYMLGNVA